jgi:hypothetical protein
VGRPGLDPGTLGLKGTFHRLFCVGLVAHVHCFQENVLFCVGLVVWCCRNMRPKMWPVRLGVVDYEQLIRDALKKQSVTDWVDRHPYGMVMTKFSREEGNPLTVRFKVQVLCGPRVLRILQRCTSSRLGLKVAMKVFSAETFTRFPSSTFL